MENPVISIVAVGRNDDYGGDFRSRLSSWVHWTHGQLSARKIPSELIFVNYNPLPESDIEDFIDWPASNNFVRVRIITVPTDVHEKNVAEKQLKNVPVQEYLAKNVGLRRANGKFLLAMNPDILISEKVFDKFTSLSKNSYYRADRADHNGPFEVGSDVSLFGQLQGNVTGLWFKGVSYRVSGLTRASYQRYRRKAGLTNLWRRLTIYLRPLLDFLSIPVYYDRIEYKFHCNASGDFMLMHRDAWHDLRGYKESSYISLHVDSLMVLQAAFSGLHERTFFHPVFHRDHERRFDAVHKQSSDQDRVYREFKEAVKTMTKTHSPLLFNQDWGLSNQRLPEQII